MPSLEEALAPLDEDYEPPDKVTEAAEAAHAWNRTFAVLYEAQERARAEGA